MTLRSKPVKNVYGRKFIIFSQFQIKYDYYLLRIVINTFNDKKTGKSFSENIYKVFADGSF